MTERRYRPAMSPTETDLNPDRPAALGAIGSTPIVRLTRLAGPDVAEVWVKLEGANPTGSYKDRMALAMVEGAERSGRLRPGQTVVEYTGGSTGSSLAFVCAQKGYPARLVSSDAFAAAKLATMRAFGAELDLVPSPEGITPRLIPAMQARAAVVAAEIDGFQTDQFHNHDMVDGYRAMGEEILAQLDGRVDAWVTWGSSPARRPARTSSPRFRWRASWAPAGASSRSPSTPA